MALSFADFLSVEQFIEDQENENTKKKTQQNVALLKEFLTLKNESRTIEEIQRITVRKKTTTKTTNPAP
jgi:ribosomal protein S8